MLECFVVSVLLGYMLIEWIDLGEGKWISCGFEMKVENESTRHFFFFLSFCPSTPVIFFYHLYFRLYPLSGCKCYVNLAFGVTFTCYLCG